MIVLYILLTFFAIYGLLMVFYQLFLRYSRKQNDNVWAPAAIVIVDEAQGWIEWFVRKLSVQGFVTGKIKGDLFIIDVSASKETYQIISRLQTTHPFVTYVASSDAHGINDLLTLLNSSRRSQALVAAMKNESDIHRFLQTWEQLLS